MKLRAFGVGVAVVLTVASAPFVVSAQAPETDAADGSAHRARAVRVEPGVELKVLDFGGEGPPALLLAGLGNTAHVWDGLAPSLTGDFQVFALTRRGFGPSGGVPGEMGLDRLAADVVAVMDTLGLVDAVLVGHSFAGDEMTAVARAAPERVRGLAYLDAAHDRTGLPSLAAGVPEPARPPMDAAEDPSTVEGWADYLERLLGARLPEHEVEASLERTAGGDLAPRAAHGEAATALLAGIRAPAFEEVAAPVLAVYALPESPEDLYPWVGADAPAEDRRRAERGFQVYRGWEVEQIRRLSRLLPEARVEVLSGAPHHLFLSHPDTVVALLRATFGG